MKFITGKDRNQTEFFCLEQAISQDNEVRLIDLFVSAIKMQDYGFDMDFIDNGRPAYHPAALLLMVISTAFALLELWKKSVNAILN